MIKRRAFTLVELLVVIAIVGMLSTVAVVSLESAREKSRNTKRTADIKQLVTAFSLGLDANGSYPSTGGDLWRCISSSCTGGWNIYPLDTTVDAFFQPFMANKPTDPNDNNSRGYGGYLYNGASAVVNNLPTILYLLEPPATCGVGTLIGATADYVQCAVNLN